MSTCAECGFVFTSPRPGPDTIGSFYKSEQYISHSDVSRTFTDKLYQAVRRWTLHQKLKRIRRFHKAGALLDIGCGTGHFLEYAQRCGFQVTGVEPSLEARTRAQGSSITVHPDLSAIPTKEQFSVVSLWHVLEHVPDPKTTLKQIHARIDKQGILAIAVPDRESWDAAYYGKWWAAWDVPRHYWHFSSKDIERLLDEHGFTLVETRRMLFDAPYVSILSESYKGSSKWSALIRGGVIGLWSNLISFISQRPSSSTMYIARKRSAV